MTLPKLSLAPSQESYTFTMPTGVLEANLDGGPPRTRLDVVGQYIPVTCQWDADSNVLQYLQQAYRYCEANGGAHFLIDLVVDQGTLTEREAMFMPGTAKLQSVQGNAYIWGAVLLVAPLTGLDVTWPPDTDYQSAILAAEDGDLLGT
jgi:hypothetical protein